MDRHDYVAPQVTDHGDLASLTLATGQVGDEDGAGKTIQQTIGPIDVSVGVFP